MSKNLEYFTRIRSIFKNDKLSSSFNKLLNFKLGTRSESKCETKINKSNAEIELVKLTKYSQIDDKDIENIRKKDKDKELPLKTRKNETSKENMKTLHVNMKKDDKSEETKFKINHDREEKAHLLNFVLKSSRRDEKFKRLVKNAIPPSKSINSKQLRFNSIINRREQKKSLDVTNSIKKPKKELRKWSANDVNETNKDKEKT